MKFYLVLGLVFLTLAANTKNTMQGFLHHMTELRKYFASEEAFNDPKNYEAITRELKAFAATAEKAQHDPTLSTENYKFSAHVIADQIRETERIFRLGNKAYARSMLYATTNLCMSCHTQMPAENRSFHEFSQFNLKVSDFDQAEFLFAARDYAKASEIYDRLILDFPKNGLRSDKVSTALDRQVTYYARVKQDPKATATILKKYQHNKDLPEYLKTNINAWIQQADKWSKEKNFNVKTASDEQLEKFVKDNLGEHIRHVEHSGDNPNLVLANKVSGVLYQYLQLHPHSQLVPKILYWLAVSDRAGESMFHVSLADLYLRECISEYPQAEIANDCFKEYQDVITQSYTGTMGTNLPKDVRDDLAALKKIIENHGKVEATQKH